MRKAQAVFLLILLPYPALAQVQTTVSAAPPSLGADDPDATYCRPPQHRTDSQLMGPKVCMTNREWADLRANGFEIGPDGVKVWIKKNIDLLSR
jgi:hypothetical protein